MFLEPSKLNRMDEPFPDNFCQRSDLKVLVGFGRPKISVERWMERFEQLKLRPEMQQKILLNNAKILFSLEL